MSTLTYCTRWDFQHPFALLAMDYVHLVEQMEVPKHNRIGKCKNKH